MESERQTWNDARMDEFAERTEANFSEVRAEFGKVREEIRSETQGLRTEMHAGFERIERRFDILYGAMATGFIGAVISHFLG